MQIWKTYQRWVWDWTALY